MWKRKATQTRFLLLLLAAVLGSGALAALAWTNIAPRPSFAANGSDNTIFLPIVFDQFWPGATYFVATTGNDGNPGTEQRPFRTIKHALKQVEPNDIIFVRGGVYNEVVTLDKDGLPEAPISLRAYPGERPIIDGNYTLPPKPNSGWGRCNDTVQPPRCFHYNPLVSIEASHVIFEGFEIRESLGRGMRIWQKDGRPQDVTVRDNWIHNSRNAALIILDADDVLVENNRVWQNINYATHDRSASVMNWPHAVNMNFSTNVTIRGNHVYENWGEGIGAGRGSVGVTVEDNVVYDNKLQIYVHRAQDVIVQRNLVYCTNRDDYLRGGDPPPGIVVNNEENFDGDLIVENAVIVNNIITGCRLGFGMWGGGGNPKIGSRDVLFAYNTLVNAVNNDNGDGDVALGINISDAPHENVVIRNNIVQQGDGELISLEGSAQITLASNLWSRTPPANAAGPGDIVANPQLANPDAPLLAGSVTAVDFEPQQDAPGVNTAVSADSVSVDYYGRSRDAQPDRGAIEYEFPTPTPTATATATATATPSPTPTADGPPTSTPPPVPNGP